MLYSLAIWTLCCLVFKVASGQQAVEKYSCRCPLGWLCSPTAQYKYIAEAKSWIDAELYCQKLQQGAHLASIHDADENDFIDYVIFRQTQKHPTVWIGASDCYKNRHFLWVDGSRMGYQNYANGEPNNAGGREPCVNFNYVSPKTWNDEKCEVKFPFICKFTYPRSF